MVEFGIIAIGITILLGFLGNVLFQKTSIPNTLWLLIFGVVLSLFNFVGRDFIFQSAGLIGAIAIIGILSDGGMHLDLKKVLSNGFAGIILMLFGLVFSIIATTVVLLAFSFPLSISILVAVILAGTSAAVIIPTVMPMHGISDRLKTILSMESTSDNFSVVIALILIDLLSGKSTAFGSASIFQGTFLQLFSAIAIGIIFGFFWAPLLSRLKKYEFAYTATLSAFILLYAFAELIGSSGAITVFSTGIMLANSYLIFNAIFPEKKLERLDDDINKAHSLISFLIRVFFFVFLGLVVGIPKTGFLLMGLLITIAIIVFRFVYIKVLSFFRLLDFSAFERKIAAVMVPRGLSSAVLVVFALSARVPFAEEIVQVVFSVILFSIIATTVGVTVFRPKEKKQKPVGEEQTMD